MHRRYIGTTLRRLRAEAGWSLKELERRSVVSRGQLSRYERNITPPMPRTIRRIAAAFGMVPAAFYEQLRMDDSRKGD